MNEIDICKNTYETTIFIIFCIIVITLFVSIIILMLNIINYILFTIYCINDNIVDYTSENPESIIMGNKYKYRLLNYIKNINDNNPENNYLNYSVIKEYFDTNSSDLYIHKTIIYYNYIVKLLLAIILVIIIGLLYNIFKIGILTINNCDDNKFCGFILTDILNKDSYIYYIIIIIFLYIYVHSYVYTYFFNQNIYRELYDIYGGENGAAGAAGTDGVNKYKTIDTIVSNSINHIINNTTEKIEMDEGIPLYLNDYKDLSYDILTLKDVSDYTDNIIIINKGIINNNKFIIPSNTQKDLDITKILKRIYKDFILLDNFSNKVQILLGHKIFLYLIYHFVISKNIEDPFIIHKLNNVYLNIFDNLYEKYKEEEAKKEETKEGDVKKEKEDPNIFLERFDSDTKKMYKEIRIAYTIKLLLPVIEKYKILDELHTNADNILNYINKERIKGGKKEMDDLKNYNILRSRDTIVGDVLYQLISTIKKNIDDFADGFSEYEQENKTIGVINRVVYKVNFYLAIEMMETIIYILIVLLLLYKSGKYPYMEKYINIAITYAIIIMNELQSAILGIV